MQKKNPLTFISAVVHVPMSYNVESEGAMQVQVAHSKQIPPGEKKFLHGVPPFFSGGIPGGGGGYEKKIARIFFPPPPWALAHTLDTYDCTRPLEVIQITSHLLIEPKAFPNIPQSPTILMNWERILWGLVS